MISNEETRDDLLEAAGILKYARILGETVDLNQIFELYWRSLFPSSVGSILSSRFLGENSQNDHLSYLQRGMMYLYSYIKYSVENLGFLIARNVLEASQSSRNIRPILLALILSVRHVLIKDIDIQKYVNVREILLSPEVGIDISVFPIKMQEVFHKGVLGYFGHAPLILRGRMVAAVVSLSPRESQNDFVLIKAVMNRAGPALQKMMQMFGNEVKNESFKRLMDGLKDGIQPMSEAERSKAISELFGDSGNWVSAHLPYFSESQNLVEGNPPSSFFHGRQSSSSKNEILRKNVNVRLLSLDQNVGAASIGEGWIAKVQFGSSFGFSSSAKPPEQVFLKLKRWNIEHIMRAEIEVIRSIMADYPELGNIFDELIKDLMEELDWDLEVANQILGHQLLDYGPRKNKGKEYDGLFVPMPKALIESENSGCIIMPLASGISLSKVLSNNLLDEDNACAVVGLWKNFMKTWISNLMQRGGKGHGDPHSGNCLVGFHPEPAFSWLTILDWGNTISITKKVQVNLHDFIFAVLMKDPNGIVNSLGRTVQNYRNPMWKEFKRRIRDIFGAIRDIMDQRRSWSSRARLNDLNHRSDLMNRRLNRYGLRYTEKTPAERDEFISVGTDHIESDDDDDEFYSIDECPDCDGIPERNPETDGFSITSPEVQEKILQLDSWNIAERFITTIDNILAVAVELGVPLPEGTASIFRARRFMEKTLEDFKENDAVIKAKCVVPSSIMIFMRGLISLSGFGSSVKKSFGTTQLCTIGSKVKACFSPFK